MEPEHDGPMCRVCHKQQSFRGTIFCSDDCEKQYYNTLYCNSCGEIMSYNSNKQLKCPACLNLEKEYGQYLNEIKLHNEPILARIKELECQAEEFGKTITPFMSGSNKLLLPIEFIAEKYPEYVCFENVKEILSLFKEVYQRLPDYIKNASPLLKEIKELTSLLKGDISFFTWVCNKEKTGRAKLA